MSFTNGHDTTPLLTAADVMRWRDELTDAQRIIAHQHGRAAELLRKLEAAAVFMPPETMPPGVRPGGGGVGKSATLYDAIRKVVLASDVPMSPKMIRQAIEGGPDADLIGSENYLYTAIKRIADKGEITKEGTGYVPAF